MEISCDFLIATEIPFLQLIEEISFRVSVYFLWRHPRHLFLIFCPTLLGGTIRDMAGVFILHCRIHISSNILNIMRNSSENCDKYFNFWFVYILYVDVKFHFQCMARGGKATFVYILNLISTVMKIRQREYAELNVYLENILTFISEDYLSRETFKTKSYKDIYEHRNLSIFLVTDYG